MEERNVEEEIRSLSHPIRSKSPGGYVDRGRKSSGNRYFYRVIAIIVQP